MRRRIAALAATLAVVAGGGFAIGRASTPDPAAGADPAAASRPGAAPGEADVRFVQDMAMHHDQGVLMANLALSRGGPAVRALAEAIVVTQSQEVGLMRGWLRLWDAPATADGHAGAMASMPGMATPTQLDELYAGAGERFDVMFLRLMIRHHQGALLMVDGMRGDDVLAVTRAAGEGISASQIEEIGTMTALLRTQGVDPLPPPG